MDSLERPTTLAVLTYNLWEGRAQSELPGLVRDHGPDVVCVQEARAAALPTRIGGMRLAVATSQNRLGIAIYLRAGRLDLLESRTVQLRTSRHDRWVGGTDHRLAAARVADRVTGRELTLGSFHATPFTDSNAARRRQVDDAHDALRQLGPGLPSVMAGDYNHPILLFMLDRHLRRRGFAMARTATSTYRREGNAMRGKFDVATVSGVEVVEAAVLPQGGSDHLPVLFTLRTA
jgi:exodeoxyribonuclease III